MGTLAAATIVLLAILSIDDHNGECENSDLHKSGAFWLISAAGLGLIFESIITILRLLDVNINVLGKVVSIEWTCKSLWCHFYFNTQDVLLRSLLIVSLLAGGAVNAIFAIDNADTYNRLKPCPDNDQKTEKVCFDVKWLRDSEIAAAVSYYMELTHLRIEIQSLVILVCIPDLSCYVMG